MHRICTRWTIFAKGLTCIFWFINHCLVYLRCWRRKEWQSYSLRTKQTVVVVEDDIVLLCLNRDKISGKESIKQHCLIVLYKVNTISKDKGNTNLLESTSSVWNRKSSVNKSCSSIRNEIKGVDCWSKKKGSIHGGLD